MPAFQIAYNGRTTFYEVHAAGCRHLAMGATGNPYTAKFDYVNPPAEAESAKAFAAKFEAESEGCLTKLGPCAKAAKAVTCHCGQPARTDNDSGVCDQWPTCEAPKGTS